MQTKYPIVLVHGVALKNWQVVKAFGRIGKTLQKEGYIVFSANTDGFGSIENNAKQLKSEIQEILRQVGAEKVNIIAHSKGGLDSIYMINELGMANSVASLTTLSTPHKGSGVATMMYDLPIWIKSFLAFWINLWYRIFGDKTPDALTVCEQLKLTENGELKQSSMPNEIYCQSYSSTLKNTRDDFLMAIPLQFSRRFDSWDTDGLVSVESAKFAEYKGNLLDESLSHSEIVGYSMKKKKREKVYAFYLHLCKELSEQGF